MSVEQAKARLVQSFSDYIDELTASIKRGAQAPAAKPAVTGPPVGPPGRLDQQPAKRPRPVVDAQVQLPKPLIPGKAELSDAARKEAMKDGLPIAKKAKAAIGAGSPHFREALQGGLALAHIPFDSQVLDDLTAAVQ